MTTTLLLVENDHFHRAGVKLYLEYKGFKVIEAEDKSTAQTLALKHKPNVAVIDIGIPVDPQSKYKWEESSGAELALWLKERTPDLGVVLFSAHSDRGQYLFEMINRGFRGLAYKVKGTPVKELLDAIKRVQLKAIIIDKEVTDVSAQVGTFED